MRVFNVDLAKEYNRKGGVLSCLLADEPFDTLIATGNVLPLSSSLAVLIKW